MPSFTKNAIKASFMKLLNEQPLSKISVRAIVEDCGINRNSFYYHFQDIPSLIKEIVEEVACNLIHEYPGIASIEECFNAAFKFAVENKRAILHIYNSVNRTKLEEYLMRNCETVVVAYVDNIFGEENISERNRNTVIRFFKYELFGAFIEWMNDGMPDSAVEELQNLMFLCHGLTEELIKRCKEA